MLFRSIKRVDAETPAPVQVITREQIERSGAQSVTEVLKSVPASNAGGFDENAVASFTPGAGGVSLRGLGVQATLVLINGRRIAPYGFASGGQQTFTDVNSIPLEAVERIDVLLDGASAIYGSDAMAGVINIILRRDYKGLSLNATAGTSSHGDANKNSVGIAFGTGSLASDGYNVFGTFSHNQADPVKASDRSITHNADFRRFGLTDLRSSYAGNLYSASGLAGGTFLGHLSTCTPLSEAGAATNGRCVYDGTQHQDIIAKTQRDSLFLSGTLDVGAGFELFSDASFTHFEYEAESPSYSSSTYYSTGTLPTAYIPLPVGHPQNPTNDVVALRYRFDDVAHTTEVITNTQRVVAGVRNRDLAGWDAESAAVYSHSKSTITTHGLLRDSVLLDSVLDTNGMANNSFIFGNPSANDPSLMAALYPTLKDVGTTTTSSVDLRGSRELFNLPAGPLAVALGTEFRHEAFTSTPDALEAAGELSVLGSSSSDGSRNVSAAYVEFSAPVTKTVEASLAGRVDHYSDFGTATTPKAGIKWKVLPNLAQIGRAHV